MPGGGRGQQQVRSQCEDWLQRLHSMQSRLECTARKACTMVHHSPRVADGRGEIVEDTEPPLGLGVPMLLVKPPVGLSTPEIFRALDLSRRSDADPRQLLNGIAAERRLTPQLCINDLEQPAFDRHARSFGGGLEGGGRSISRSCQ
jgi:hypothetical protein